MKSEYPKFIFKLDLSNPSIEKHFVELFKIYCGELKGIFRELNYSPDIPFGRLTAEAQRWVINTLKEYTNRYIYDHNGKIPVSSDESNSYIFYLTNGNFNLEITGKDGEYKIFLTVNSQVKILGSVGNKFIFKPVSFDNEKPIEDSITYFINSDKISFISSYDGI